MSNIEVFDPLEYPQVYHERFFVDYGGFFVIQVSLN